MTVAIDPGDMLRPDFHPGIVGDGDQLVSPEQKGGSSEGWRWKM
jgi:hypothetical protein